MQGGIKMKKGGRWSLLVLILLITFPLWGTGQQEGTETIKIGVSCSLTGAWAANDLRMRHSLEMAVEEVNSAGGIKGRPIQLIYEDAESSSGGAIKAYNKIASEHSPPVIIAAPFSVQVLALEPYIRKEAIPTLSGATSRRLTEMGNRWLFRIRAHDGIVAALAATFAVEKLGASKIGILHDTNEYGTGGALAMKETLQKYAKEPLVTVGYNTGDKDFAAQLLTLSQKGCEVVLSWAHPLEGGLILRQIKQLGLGYKIVGGPGYAMPVCLDLAKQDAEAINVVIDFSVANQDPRVQSWVERYQKKFAGEIPDYVSACHYDAIYILAKVMEENGFDRGAIRNGLEAMQPYQGVMAEYDFDDKGDGVYETVIVQIRDGVPVVMQTVKVK